MNQEYLEVRAAGAARAARASVVPVEDAVLGSGAEPARDASRRLGRRRTRNRIAALVAAAFLVAVGLVAVVDDRNDDGVDVGTGPAAPGTVPGPEVPPAVGPGFQGETVIATGATSDNRACLSVEIERGGTSDTVPCPSATPGRLPSCSAACLLTWSRSRWRRSAERSSGGAPSWRVRADPSTWSSFPRARRLTR